MRSVMGVRSWRGTAAAVMLGTFAVATLALAAEDKADATLRLETKQVSVGVGWSWGSGVLDYKGGKHSFKVEGLAVNAVGASATEATGYVYNLKRLEDFPGTYTAVEASGTLGGGKGIVTMKNANDVRITLHTTSAGVSAQVGPEGVRISMK